MSASIRRQLEAMQKARKFVRLSRRFERSPVRGYVMDIGPKFFLLALVSDRIWFDGYECFRIADIRSVRPDPYTTFDEAALKMRGERRPRKPRINLNTIEDLLLSADRAFPLVTIHRDEADSGACWIGKVAKVDRGRVSLLEIDPAAKWSAKPTDYRLREITRVSFGGDYEDALHLVGGDPPH